MSRDQEIETLHKKLVDQMTDNISECLDEGEALNLTPGEAIGICAATLIDALAHLLVSSETPEQVMLAWCHDQYLAVQKYSRDQQN